MDYLSFAAVELSWAASPLWTKMLGLRTLWILRLVHHWFFPYYIFDREFVFLPPREHTPSHDIHDMRRQKQDSEHADDTDNATTVPSSTSNSRQHRHARVVYPYVVFTVLHTAVQQYTYNSKPMVRLVLELR